MPKPPPDDAEQGARQVWVSRTRAMLVAGVVAVVVGAIAAAAGAWTSDVDLRSGVIPWAFGALSPVSVSS